MWICSECGHHFGKYRDELLGSTWHYGECHWCKQKAIVTEPRDFSIFPKDKNNDNRND